MKTKEQLREEALAAYKNRCRMLIDVAKHLNAENMELKKELNEVGRKWLNDFSRQDTQITELKAKWEELKEIEHEHRTIEGNQWISLGLLKRRMQELEQKQNSGGEVPNRKAKSEHSLIPSVEPRTRTDIPHNLRVRGGEGETHGTLKPDKIKEELLKEAWRLRKVGIYSMRQISTKLGVDRDELIKQLGFYIENEKKVKK